jgi:hypothetical protein
MGGKAVMSYRLYTGAEERQQVQLPLGTDLRFLSGGDSHAIR